MLPSGDGPSGDEGVDLGHAADGFAERDPSLTDQVISLLLLGIYLERMADHVTNIGERIWYMETGELKELHE